MNCNTNRREPVGYQTHQASASAAAAAPGGQVPYSPGPLRDPPKQKY